ncbi:MAG: hypothetical protein Q8Q35_02900 [Nanoarchaeota archaeon]|nr:hypothetical protein [Nanoarchaeota archaeon]
MKKYTPLILAGALSSPVYAEDNNNPFLGLQELTDCEVQWMPAGEYVMDHIANEIYDIPFEGMKDGKRADNVKKLLSYTLSESRNIASKAVEIIEIEEAKRDLEDYINAVSESAKFQTVDGKYVNIEDGLLNLEGYTIEGRTGEFLPLVIPNYTLNEGSITVYPCNAEDLMVQAPLADVFNKDKLNIGLLNLDSDSPTEKLGESIVESNTNYIVVSEDVIGGQGPLVEKQSQLENKILDLSGVGIFKDLKAPKGMSVVYFDPEKFSSWNVNSEYVFGTDNLEDGLFNVGLCADEWDIRTVAEINNLNAKATNRALLDHANKFAVGSEEYKLIVKVAGAYLTDSITIVPKDIDDCTKGYTTLNKADNIIADELSGLGIDSIPLVVDNSLISERDCPEDLRPKYEAEKVANLEKKSSEDLLLVYVNEPLEPESLEQLIVEEVKLPQVKVEEVVNETVEEIVPETNEVQRELEFLPKRSGSLTDLSNLGINVGYDVRNRNSSYSTEVDGTLTTERAKLLSGGLTLPLVSLPIGEDGSLRPFIVADGVMSTRGDGLIGDTGSYHFEERMYSLGGGFELSNPDFASGIEVDRVLLYERLDNVSARGAKTSTNTSGEGLNFTLQARVPYVLGNINYQNIHSDLASRTELNGYGIIDGKANLNTKRLDGTLGLLFERPHFAINPNFGLTNTIISQEKIEVIKNKNIDIKNFHLGLDAQLSLGPFILGVNGEYLFGFDIRNEGNGKIESGEDNFNVGTAFGVQF